MKHNPRVLAIDAGGTMTDTFLIDESGEFVVGKAQTTPENESIAFIDSCNDALKYWGGIPVEEAFPQIVSGVYSGTAMLNRLLARKGRRLGLIVTAGQEDALRLERGTQTYLGYSYSDRLARGDACAQRAAGAARANPRRAWPHRPDGAGSVPAI